MPVNITVVGSLNIDLVVQAPRLPQPGETILSGSDLQQIPGGKGANQAVAAAKLDAQVSMLGKVGGDNFAKIVLESMGDVGVDTAAVLRDPASSTGVALIIVDKQGENSIVVASGANMKFRPADVNAATIQNADVVVMQLEVPIETNIHSAKIAKGAGTTVILNPAPAQSLPAELLANVDILILNESETALLTDLPVGSQEELEAAAAALREMGPQTIILTLGARGAMLLDENTNQLVSPYIVNAVDTTAAGDGFVGSFAVEQARGMSMLEAVQYSNAVGALTATQFGAQPALPTRSQVENFMQANKQNRA